MFGNRPPPGDGYEYVGAIGTVIRLVDPAWCPAGHPVELTQRSNVNCEQHQTLHHEWTCVCGQVIWRHDGAFVGELPCC